MTPVTLIAICVDAHDSAAIEGTETERGGEGAKGESIHVSVLVTATLLSVSADVLDSSATEGMEIERECEGVDRESAQLPLPVKATLTAVFQMRKTVRLSTAWGWRTRRRGVRV